MLDYLQSAPLAAASLVAVASAVLLRAMLFSFKNYLPLQGKNVFVGGGSQGLGLSLAKLVLSRGAHVTIVSRSQHKLNAALKELEASRKNDVQRIHAVSADLTTSKGASDAFDQYASVNGVPVPDYIFSCQGGAGGFLGYFPELTPEQLSQGWAQNYETAMWTAHQASKRMIENKVQGKIVFVSSVIGLMSYIGWSAYSPAKYAIRGLADTLRNEFKLYGITVHTYFPGTILSPGFELENENKPDLTKKIEGDSTAMSSEACAAGLIRGLEQNQFFITTDLISHICRSTAKGASPSSHLFLDHIYRLIGIIGLPIWLADVDRQVYNAPEAKKYRQSL